MRLHHLTIQAFGPFAERVEVDLDALAESGLFLLTGPTGAGKSSVLDAISFALYGVVPGVRQTAKHPRSDHAQPGVAPEVTLEFSVGARRFRSRRTPAWERPKKRGSGTTTQQASVVIEEERADGWQVVANRLDEAGLLITELLAMSADQFHQVALLPQGEFASFLQASSADRHAVLERLFRTDRFSRVERWLVDHRKALRQTVRQRQESVAALVSRLLEVTGQDMPDQWDLADLAPTARAGSIAPWAEQIHERTEAGAEQARSLAEFAEQVWVRTDAEFHRARQVADLRARGAAATEAVARLAHDADDWHARQTALVAHDRAATTAHLAREQAALESDLERRRDDRRTLAGAWGLADCGSADVAERHTEAAQRARTLDGLVPVAESAARHDDAAALLEQGVAADKVEREKLTAAAATLPTEIARCRDVLVEATAVAARSETHHAAVREASAALAAATELVALRQQVRVARQSVQTATDAVLHHKETWLDLRERRIEGMAGELAGQLAVGCACPVCGSDSHPSPAHTAMAIDRDEEEAARKRLDTSEIALTVAAEELTPLEHRVTTLVTRTADHDVAHWQRALAEAQSLAGAADDAADRVTELQARIDDLTAHHERMAADLAECDERTRAHESELSSARASAAADRRRIAEVLPDVLSHSEQDTGPDAEHDTAPDVRALVATAVAEATATLTRLTSVVDLDRAIAAAEREVARTVSSAESAALAANFPDLETALAARLTDDVATAWTAELESRRQSEQRARAVLDDPAVTEAMVLEQPDLDTLTRARNEAAARRDAATSALATATSASGRTSSLVADLVSEVTAWLPEIDALDLAVALSQLVEGTSVDNALRMRLSAYVLGERLRRVVEAANDRLVRMGSRRFQLEHSDTRGAGEHRGGLSLRVRDDWTGTTRDPVTLSGGETFVVSLALALGLADTVSQESGGIRIDTLFIDEGFGSLDADTLEEVMDTLDGLREGGRVIGVVSHVAEMRERITTQLAVIGGAQGSTLRTRSAGTA